MVKRCSKCGETKRREDFYRDRSRKDGRSAICRGCRTEVRQSDESRAYHAAYRKAHYEELKERDRQRFRSLTPAEREAERQRLRKYHLENSELTKQRAREWDLAHPEQVRKRRIAWHEANPEKVAITRKLTYQRRRGAERLSRADRRLAKAYINVIANDPCVYCGDPSEVIDHILALRIGGNGQWDNLTSACRACNARKNAKPLLAFMAGR